MAANNTIYDEACYVKCMGEVFINFGDIRSFCHVAFRLNIPV